jgi:DegV family protein with EDD domain
MAKVAIVTDSTVNLPQSVINEYSITVVPQIVIWDEKIYLDGIDIRPAEFYTRLQSSQSMPSSSQVSPITLKDTFSGLLDKGFDVLAITVSSKLSGTMNSAIQAKDMLPGKAIELVDSLTASMALGFQVLMAARAAKNGASLQECKAIAEKARKQSGVYFVVDTLEFLHRGGRIGGAARLLGTALNLKPILTVIDGKIEPVARVRTQRKAFEKMLNILADKLDHGSISRLSVLHANAASQADQLMSELAQRFHPAETIMTEVSPVIGTHTGPGTVGVAYLIDM